jgi:hypothetical protein
MSRTFAGLNEAAKGRARPAPAVHVAAAPRVYRRRRAHPLVVAALRPAAAPARIRFDLLDESMVRRVTAGPPRPAAPRPRRVDHLTTGWCPASFAHGKLFGPVGDASAPTAWP